MDDMMNVTVGKLLEQVAEKYPDDEAVKFTDRDYRRTWKEFNEEAETIAKGFLEMGIRKGDHVAIWATNVPEWMLTFFACTKIGAVLVTVNTAYTVFEPAIRKQRLPAWSIGKSCIKRRKKLMIKRSARFMTVSIRKISAICSIPPEQPVSPRELC